MKIARRMTTATATMTRTDGDPIVHIDVTLVTRKRTSGEGAKRSATAKGIVTVNGTGTVRRGRGDTGMMMKMTSRASGKLMSSTVLNIPRMTVIACRTGRHTAIGKERENQSA